MIIPSSSSLLKEELKSLTEYGIYTFIIDFAIEELELE